MRRTVSALAVLTLLVAGGLLPVAQPPASAATGASGQYHAVAPRRILDTRTAAGGGALAARATRALAVTGSLVPSSASAVVLTATVTGPTAGGYLTVYPAGGNPPATSSLNFLAGRTVPNLVVVRLGAGGKIDIYNGSSGRSHVLVDVAGYFTGSNAPSGQGAFGSLVSPRRILDTRSGAAVAGGASRSFTVTGNGVPAGASAVVLNLTATAEATSGWAAAYGAGETRPSTSNLNFDRGVTLANLAVVPVGVGGRVTLYNGSSGSAHFLADISGYFLAGDPVAAGALGSLIPARILDTRSGVGAAKAALGAGKSVALTVAGRAGVPKAGVAAVVLNVTATLGRRSGHLTVYGAGSPPTVSQVNYGAGQTVADLVVAPVSSGKVTIYNGSSGSVQVIADVSGYVLGIDLPVPVVSTSRYVRDITDGGSTDVETMYREGCADAKAGSRFVVLELGAQSVSLPQLSSQNPGVLLTGTTTTRLTYPQVRAAVGGYLAGYASCSPAQATVAVGTNNDGVFSGTYKYPADTRGTDWAADVVGPLRTLAATSAPNVTVVGANDIEAADFSGDEQQAEDWENAYLADTTVGWLLFDGSADGCPTTYGAIDQACAFGWTQDDYYYLAHGLKPDRIRALPQIYVPEQAVQWANINASGGNALDFAGALTEWAACPTANPPACNVAALPPAQGWAALYHSLSTIAGTPSLPALSDLQIDD